MVVFLVAQGQAAGRVRGDRRSHRVSLPAVAAEEGALEHVGDRHNRSVASRAPPAVACFAVAAVSLGVRTPQPATLVLRGADVGAAYSGRGAVVSNAEAGRGGPPGFAPRLARWGRIDGYQIDFTRRAGVGTLQDGPLEVKSAASVYRSGDGARRAFVYARGHLVPAGYVPLPLGFTVGDEARQWVSEGASGLGTMLQYVLIWRERTVDASIVVTGRVGVVSAADLAPLARRQDARIRAAIR